MNKNNSINKNRRLNINISKFIKSLFSKMKNSKFFVSYSFIIMGIFCLIFGRLFVFLVYTLCALLHELGHAFVASKMGYKIDKIILMPFGAELKGEFDEFGGNDEILVALAGPMSNIILCILCVFMWWTVPSVYSYTMDFCVANLVLALFNLLPLFPLDGGRILLAVLSRTRERRQAVKILKTASIVFSFILLSLFVFTFNVTFLISAVMFVCSCIFDIGGKYIRNFNVHKSKKAVQRGLIKKTYIVLNDSSLLSLWHKLKPNYYINFEVVDEKLNVIKTLNENDLLFLLNNHHSATRINNINI